MNDRKSNFELARIIAMLLIVLVHANYFSLGRITQEGVLASPTFSFVRIVLEQLCIVGVNLFVLISGWFGIRPTLKGGTSLIFQVAFYAVIILLIGLTLGLPIPRSILKVFYFGGYYWFVPAYLCLYVLSPVLNAFIENSSRRTHLSVVIAFFSCEIIFGWLIDMGTYAYGYSAISFIGLYLLARYVSMYSDRLKSIKAIKCLCIYLLFTILPALLAFFGLKHTGHSFRSFSYNSPFVITASLFLLLAFQRLEFKSKFVNWVACSVFSVYLIHLNPIISPYFEKMMKFVFGATNGIVYILFSLAVAILVLLSCATFDKLRILSWKSLCKNFLDNIFARGEQKFNSLIR